MNLLRAALLAAWIILWLLAIRALAQLGPAEAMVFVGDFAHPWRAMINADFVVHLAIVALWILYRERSPAIGIPCAALAFLGGMPFTLAYLVVTTYREDGDLRRVLLGRHFPGGRA